MRLFNASVDSSYRSRDGDWVLFIKPDKGALVQVRWDEDLPHGRRVWLSADGKIERVG